MFRRYNRWWGRFDQPDPADFSYDLADPQSFNRYSYTRNDPVNFVDPLGLSPQDPRPQPTPIHRPLGWTEEDERALIDVVYTKTARLVVGEFAAEEGTDGPGGLFGGGAIAFPAKGVNDLNTAFTARGLVGSVT